MDSFRACFNRLLFSCLGFLGLTFTFIQAQGQSFNFSDQSPLRSRVFQLSAPAANVSTLSEQSASPSTVSLNATGILLSKNYFIFNYHVWERARNEQQKLTQETDDQKLNQLTLAGLSLNGIVSNIHPLSLEYCTKTQDDYCVLSLPSFIATAPLDRAKIAMKPPEKNALLYLFGNDGGDGLSITEAFFFAFTSQKLIDGERWVEEFEYCPKSKDNDQHDFRGNSGGLIFDENGDIVGMQKYATLEENPCGLNHRSTVIHGLFLPALLENIKLNKPSLYESLF